MKAALKHSGRRLAAQRRWVFAPDYRRMMRMLVTAAELTCVASAWDAGRTEREGREGREGPIAQWAAKRGDEVAMRARLDALLLQADAIVELGRKRLWRNGRR